MNLTLQWQEASRLTSNHIVLSEIHVAIFPGKKGIELEKKRSFQPKLKAKKKKKLVGKSPAKQDVNEAVNGDESIKECALDENEMSDHEAEKEAQEQELSDRVSPTGSHQP